MAQTAMNNNTFKFLFIATLFPYCKKIHYFPINYTTTNQIVFQSDLPNNQKSNLPNNQKSNSDKFKNL